MWQEGSQKPERKVGACEGSIGFFSSGQQAAVIFRKSLKREILKSLRSESLGLTLGPAMSSLYNVG